MLIAQISDMHVNAPGSEAVGGADAAAALARCVEHLNRLAPQPDLVVATGDLAAHGTAADYALFRELVAPLAAPLYLLPGNHDDRDELRRAFPDHGYWPADGEFLHYVLEEHPVRLIVLDTLLPGWPGGELCEARLGWLAARLAEAPDRPTVIFMHHPPFATGLPLMDAMNCAGGEAMGAIVARHPQVERVLCGHVHRPVVVRWNGTVAGTAPSTLVQLRFEARPEVKPGWTDEPPACLLHLWRPDAGLVSHLSPIGDYTETPVQ